jgi:hypothetical protein
MQHLVTCRDVIPLTLVLHRLRYGRQESVREKRDVKGKRQLELWIVT